MPCEAEALCCHVPTGSFGCVFKGVRGGVQDVAVKVLNISTPDAKERQAFEKVSPSLQDPDRCSAGCVCTLKRPNASCHGVTLMAPVYRERGRRLAGLLLRFRTATQVFDQRRRLTVLPMLSAQEISLLKAISYDRNLVQFYGAVLNVEQPMLVSGRCRSGLSTVCKRHAPGQEVLLAALLLPSPMLSLSRPWIPSVCAVSTMAYTIRAVPVIF